MSRKPKLDDIEIFHQYDIHLPSRTIYIGSASDSGGEESGVDYVMAERVIKNLHILDSTNNDPINLVMSCIGGDFIYGRAIYDAIRSCVSPVHGTVNGYAMSAGSFILQACDVRYMHEHSTMMLHYGQETLGGHAKDVQRWAKWGEKGSAWMEELYLSKIREENPDFTKAKLRHVMNFDFILQPKEALHLGLIDGIVLPDGIELLKKEETNDSE